MDMPVGIGTHQVARLCIVDYSDKISQEAIDLLREAGFQVSFSPVSGIGQPILTLGPYTYTGIWEIREFVEAFKHMQKVGVSSN